MMRASSNWLQGASNGGWIGVSSCFAALASGRSVHDAGTKERVPSGKTNVRYSSPPRRHWPSTCSVKPSKA